VGAKAMAQVIPIASPPSHAPQIKRQHEKKNWEKADSIEPDPHGRAQALLYHAKSHRSELSFSCADFGGNQHRVLIRPISSVLT
jgi:hypothetical protein